MVVKDPTEFSLDALGLNQCLRKLHAASLNSGAEFQVSLEFDSLPFLCYITVLLYAVKHSLGCDPEVAPG